MPVAEGVALAPRPFCIDRGGRPRGAFVGGVASTFGLNFGTANFGTALAESFPTTGRGIGGLTGSYAGLSGSDVIGPGVDGVD